MFLQPPSFSVVFFTRFFLLNSCLRYSSSSVTNFCVIAGFFLGTNLCLIPLSLCWGTRCTTKGWHTPCFRQHLFPSRYAHRARTSFLVGGMYCRFSQKSNTHKNIPQESWYCNVVADTLVHFLRYCMIIVCMQYVAYVYLK
ncbi:MAG: hypothetical protein UY07_C0015G0003 [Parcubacteria group bacterium GW2011_GWA1_47_8]|nr:MAG: hypothetical protein UY07_C0015G0003 [Parcubacteria group bacterium GW2011_GWA1_47_8]